MNFEEVVKYFNNTSNLFDEFIKFTQNKLKGTGLGAIYYACLTQDYPHEVICSLDALVYDDLITENDLLQQYDYLPETYFLNEYTSLWKELLNDNHFMLLAALSNKYGEYIPTINMYIAENRVIIKKLER